MEKDSKLNLILTSFLSLVLGITLTVSTEELLISVNYVLVCIFAITGLIQILNFLINKKYRNNDYTGLLLGTVFIWLAIFIYIYYTMIIIILPIILSLYSVIMGVILLIKYFNIKSATKTNYKRYLLLSFISFILSIILITRPRFTIYTYFKITGIYIIFIAIANLFEGITLKGEKNIND